MDDNFTRKKRKEEVTTPFLSHDKWKGQEIHKTF